MHSVCLLVFAMLIFSYFVVLFKFKLTYLTGGMPRSTSVRPAALPASLEAESGLPAGVKLGGSWEEGKI